MSFIMFYLMARIRRFGSTTEQKAVPLLLQCTSLVLYSVAHHLNGRRWESLLDWIHNKSIWMVGDLMLANRQSIKGFNQWGLQSFIIWRRWYHKQISRPWINNCSLPYILRFWPDIFKWKIFYFNIIICKLFVITSDTIFLNEFYSVLISDIVNV